MRRWGDHRGLTVAAVGLAISGTLAGLAWLTAKILQGQLSISDQLAGVISAYVGIFGLVATVIGTVVMVRQNRTPSPSVSETEQLYRKAVLVPRQLPTHSPHFVGRAAELDQLTALVDGVTSNTNTVPIAVISGTAGIGKTALALHWAHKIADRFPDGQLYVNLRGFDPTGDAMGPAEAVRNFLDAFQVPPERIPINLDGQLALYRSLLAERRVLVVLDNARDSDQVRPLLPGSSLCLVVVTSRSQLTSLIATGGVRLLTLGLLTVTEARELLAQYSGTRRLVDETQGVDELIELCARLPLALVIASIWFSTHPEFPLTMLVDELRDVRLRLDTLNGEESGFNIRTVFSWSYHSLSPEAKRTFRLLGTHPGPDISLSATASLVGMSEKQVHKTLSELVRAHLLVERPLRRFDFHDLLRAYASDRTYAEDNDAERRAAVHRLLDYYLHTAHTATLLLHPSRDPLTLEPPQPGTASEGLTTNAQALAWFEAEHQVLLAVIARAASDGFSTHAWQLPWCIATFFDRRGHWHDWVATQHIALAAAKQLGDQGAQARAYRGIGQAYFRLGRLEEAHTHLQHALNLYQQLGDRVGQAHTHVSITWVFDRQGHDDKALSQTLEALHLYQAADHRDGQARALNGIGWYYARLGSLDQSLTHCEQALTLFCDLGDRLGEAATYDSLGYAHHRLGHHAQALAYYHQALNLWQELGNRYYQATTFDHCGDVYRSSGDLAAAHDSWQQALAILDQLYHIDAEQVRAKLHQPRTGVPQK